MKINQSDYVTPIPEDTPEEKHKGRKNKKKRAKAANQQSKKNSNTSKKKNKTHSNKKSTDTKETVNEQIAEELVIEEPVLEEPVEEPTEEPVIEEPTEEPIEEEPVEEEPIEEEPIEEEPIEEESVEELIEEEPVIEEPIEEEPVIESAEEPVLGDSDETNTNSDKEVKTPMSKRKKILICIGSIAVVAALPFILKHAIVPVHNDLPYDKKTVSDTEDYVRNYNPKAEDVVIDKVNRDSVKDMNGDGVIDDEDYRIYDSKTATKTSGNTDGSKAGNGSNDKNNGSSKTDTAGNTSNNKTNDNSSDNKNGGSSNDDTNGTTNGKTSNNSNDKVTKVTTKENILNFFAPAGYDGSGVISKGNSGRQPDINIKTLDGTKASGFSGKVYAIGSDNSGKELTFEYDVKDLLDSPLNLNTYTTVIKPKSLSGDKEKAYWKDISNDTLICQLSGNSSDSEFYYSNSKDSVSYVKKYLGEPSCVYVKTDTDEAVLAYNFGTYYALAGFVHQSSKPQLNYISFYTAPYWEINRNLFRGDIVYGQEF